MSIKNISNPAVTPIALPTFELKFIKYSDMQSVHFLPLIRHKNT